VPHPRRVRSQTYPDRVTAGRYLATALVRERLVRPVVLALPRGGVPVACEVADALLAPLDVLLVRKLGAPGQPELGLGAISEGDVEVVDDRLLAALQVSPQTLSAIAARERAELDRRVALYRGDRTPIDVDDHDAVVVDDGIATGGTARAAIEVLRHRGARRVVVAVPVAPADTVEELSRLADLVVCPRVVTGRFAVGMFYDDFHQLTDDEVIRLLRDR
jgi:putative phosphoribosyl transferase